MSKKVVVVEMEVYFEGDYYDASELSEIVNEWIASGLEDRSDLKDFEINSYVLENNDE